MMTIAEQWEQQGIEKGEARLLQQLLTWRFGALPDWVETKLAQAESVRLEAWAKRVLDAPTLEAVFAER